MPAAQSALTRLLKLAPCLLVSITVVSLPDLSGSRNDSKGYAAEPIPAAATGKTLLVHYMPWFVAPPVSPDYGWHWTMNKFRPDAKDESSRRLASHFTPVTGPYDSSDPQILEYHLLLMKLAGLDGVIVDWYGRTDYRDYALLHLRTTRLLEHCERLGLKFVICYEDQTIPALVQAGRLTAAERVRHATDELNWLHQYWFRSGAYLRLDGEPVLLSFGHAGLTDEEWSQCLAGLSAPVAYFSQHRTREGARGGFDWPIPAEGIAGVRRFLQHAGRSPQSIAVALPRFVDIYEEAGLHASYGRIEDRDGATLRETLALAIDSPARLIQVATWNDWGEGTQIEPSVEHGDRDLRIIQELARQHLKPKLQANAADLQLPLQLLKARRATDANNAARVRQLDEISQWLAEEKLEPARKALRKRGPQSAAQAN